MTQIDDLSVGMWVAITGLKFEPPESPFGPTHHGFDGKPAQITAISLPFLCVYDGQRYGTIDVRAYELQKVNARYVKEMAKMFAQPKRKRRQKQAPVESMACPQCKTTMQKNVVQAGPLQFIALMCPSCGFGDPGRKVLG